MDTEPLEYWQRKWTQDLAPWHLQMPHASLVKHHDRLFRGKRCCVLVPFCGQTVDLKWLYDKGHEVVGVEGTTEAIEKFFKRFGLPHTKSEYGDGFRYQTTDGRLTILCRNFFTLRDEQYEKSFDCVWVSELQQMDCNRQVFRIAQPWWRTTRKSANCSQQLSSAF